MRHRKTGMHFGKVFRAVGPVMMMAAAGAMMSGCKNADIRMNGSEGVPLSELDMSGDAPDEIVLLGPDHLVITEGEDFTISLQGDDEAKERMRFVLENGSLGILREGRHWSGDNVATVNVTMPAPARITIAGSGRTQASALASEAEVVIAGSGRLNTPTLDVERLDVTIAGSGTYSAGGNAGSLELSVAGSGTADMGELMVGNADITIAGSGDTTFSSDGEVDASIMGSGNVTVRGSARCRVSSMGSGSLVCERREYPGEQPTDEAAERRSASGR